MGALRPLSLWPCKNIRTGLVWQGAGRTALLGPGTEAQFSTWCPTDRSIQNGMQGMGWRLVGAFPLLLFHTAQSHHCLSCGIQCKGFLTDLPSSTRRPTKHAPHSILHGLCEVSDYGFLCLKSSDGFPMNLQILQDRFMPTFPTFYAAATWAFSEQAKVFPVLGCCTCCSLSLEDSSSSSFLI